MGSLALVLAALADSITFLLMGTAHEANPLVAAYPIAALLSKWALVALLIAWHHRYAPPLRAFGAVVWTFGAFSNAIVLVGV